MTSAARAAARGVGVVAGLETGVLAGAETGGFAEPGIAALGAAALPAERWQERPLSWIGSALDQTVVTAMQIIVKRALVPGPEEIERVRRSAAPFLDGVLQGEPERFVFAEQRSAPPRGSERYLGPLAGGVALARRIEAFGGDPILVEHWAHVPERPRATVVAVHGFAMGYPRIDAIALQASEWFRRGLDVALLTLPFHGARAPADSSFSGDRFAAPDIGQVNRAVRQAIGELHLVVRLLRAESTAAVGVLGLSLGGYLVALLAALDSELDFVVPIAPPVCLGDLAWRFLAASLPRLGPLEPALGYEELRAALRAHSPLAHALRTPRERLLIVAGRGDRIVPPEHPYALWQHWGEPAIHWYSGGHLAPFGRRGIAMAVVEHLRRLGVL